MPTIQTLLRALAAATLALAMLVLWPAAAAAQTPALADVAKKAQDRRKSTAAPKKVYTSKDLPKPATPPPAPPAAQAPGAAAPAGPAGTGDAAAAGQNPEAAAQPGEEVKDEQWWRQQMAALRDELTRNEMFLEALQTRINSLGTDYVARDDPGQRARVAEERQRSLAMMDRVKMDIDKANKAIADLEEEARKAGVPPGWLR